MPPGKSAGAYMGETSLQFYLEPAEAIEIGELSGAFGALGRQYQVFARRNELGAKAGEARLLVSNVRPGSIDISLVPDFSSLVVTAGLFAPLVDKAAIIAKFAQSIKTLIDFFKRKAADPKAEPGDEFTVKDCDDVINILKPTANNGGSQTFNVINGGVSVTVFQVHAPEAAKLIETALVQREIIQNANSEGKKGVPMVWKRLDRDEATTTGKSSPDKGVIEEIDDKAHAILFTDETSSIKRQMIDDDENPYQKVFFVDVEISRVGGKIVSYRIVGYHGKQELEPLA